MSASTRKVTQVPGIKKYLDDIQITEPIRNRIEDIHTLIQSIHPSQIIDIFISEYVKDDGTHVYEAIDFYTDKYTFTVFDFIQDQPLIIMGYLQQEVNQAIFRYKHYNFVKATEHSRLTIDLQYDQPEWIGHLKATGRNCNHLINTYRKFFLPQLGMHAGA